MGAMRVRGTGARSGAAGGRHTIRGAPRRDNRSPRGKNLAMCNATSILVNSTAGRMGFATAESVVMAGLDLVPVSFAAIEAKERISVENVPVDVYPIGERDEVIEEVKAKHPDLIVIDFTLPDAVNSNAEFYVRNGIPFVMGTTGGDREKLLRDVSESGNYAVIAANMGKQIVALQAMLQYAAKEFPGAFSGYKLDVVESHQSTKVDTSGTAKDIVTSFNELGMPCEEEDIVKVREAKQQMEQMKVPEVSEGLPVFSPPTPSRKKKATLVSNARRTHVLEKQEYINGHAFHTYTLTSEDGTVNFQFQHNVCGRRFYAEGSVDAALFLAKQMEKKSEKKLFDMVDVLNAGAMR